MLTKKVLPLFIALALALGVVVQPQPARAAVNPSINIVAVKQNQWVTVEAFDFPLNTKFDVYLYPVSHDPTDDDLVDVFTTSKSHFKIDFDIPDELVGVSRIGIFMESRDGKYDVEAIFYNKNYNQPSGYSGSPSFTIIDVTKDVDVTLKLVNLPPNDTFKVLMDEMGNQAKGGIQVGTINTSSGGNLTKTYLIPSALKGESQIAVRIESSKSGYHYYNWFYNQTNWSSGGSSSSTNSNAWPTVKVTSVVKDQTIGLIIGGIPKSDGFAVLMAAPGTAAQDATLIFKAENRSASMIKTSVPIPPKLRGLEKIVLRVQNTDSGNTATIEVSNKTTN